MSAKRIKHQRQTTLDWYSCGITSFQTLSGTLKPTGLSRKHKLHISLERGILWPIEKEKGTTHGIGVVIVQIGQPAAMMNAQPNQVTGNYATNARQNKRLVLVNLNFVPLYMGGIFCFFVHIFPFKIKMTHYRELRQNRKIRHIAAFLKRKIPFSDLLFLQAHC